MIVSYVLRSPVHLVAFVATLVIASTIWTNSFADNSAPNEPGAPRPFSGANEQLITVTIAWEGGDPDGDGVTYDVYLGPQADPPLVASGLTSLTYMGAFLDYETHYYWRIVARDEFGMETGSPVWQFDTKPDTPPIVPFDPTPPNQSFANPTVTLRWRSADPDPQPLTYRLFFGTSNNPPLLAQGLTERHYDVANLEVNRTYYWRVVVSDGTFSVNSLTWRFYVRALPVATSTWGQIKALYH